MKKLGVIDGARTRDIPDHNRVLYQLSYVHHVLIKFLSYPFSGVVGINKDER